MVAALGANFDTRSRAETVRGPAWRGCTRQLGNLVEGSDAEDVVKKGVAGRAVSPVRC